NYLLQSLLFTTIFYGHGLGLFARIDRAGQLVIALGVAAVVLVNSVSWTRYFALGPAEWAWRSLALGRRVPMRGPADLVSARARGRNPRREGAQPDDPAVGAGAGG